jgi:hypothetical protein
LGCVISLLSKASTAKIAFTHTDYPHEARHLLAQRGGFWLRRASHECVCWLGKAAAAAEIYKHDLRESKSMLYFIWPKILFRPTTTTICDIVNSSEATIKKACKWFFGSNSLTYYLGMTILILITEGIKNPSELYQSLDRSQAIPIIILGFIVIIPLLSAIGVALLLIATGLTHKILVFFGHKGIYRQFVYVVAAFVAPLSIIRIVVFDGLTFQMAIIPLWLYACILAIVVIRALYGAKLGPALLMGIPLASFLTVPLQVFFILGATLFISLGSAIPSSKPAIPFSTQTPTPLFVLDLEKLPVG